VKKKNLKKTLNKTLILVGLGNPGNEYRETRHNVGFAVINYISDKFEVTLKKAFFKPAQIGKFIFNNSEIHLVKPLTFMNRSGDILNYVLSKTGGSINDIILICDNMDLSPGMIRLKKSGSSAGHNGIKSVIANLDSSEFKRLYVGVGRSETGESVVEHVLGRFNSEEESKVKEAVVTASEALLSLTEKDISLVMNEINKRNN